MTIPDVGHRYFLPEALYGKEQWVAQKNSATGEVGSFERVCDSAGLFLQHLEAGTPPEDSRISGVLYVEESREVGAGPYDCNALLAHNPFATKRLPGDIWGEIPQLDLKDDSLVWSDRLVKAPNNERAS